MAYVLFDCLRANIKLATQTNLHPNMPRSLAGAHAPPACVTVSPIPDFPLLTEVSVLRDPPSCRHP
jgi:hypothetical protein